MCVRDRCKIAVLVSEATARTDMKGVLARLEAPQRGQTRRPGSVVAAGSGRASLGSRRPHAYLHTAACQASKQIYGRLGSVVQPWSLSGAPPKSPISLRPTTQALSEEEAAAMRQRLRDVRNARKGFPRDEHALQRSPT